MIIANTISFIVNRYNIYTMNENDCVGCHMDNCSDYKKYYGKECKIYKKLHKRGLK